MHIIINAGIYIIQLYIYCMANKMLKYIERKIKKKIFFSLLIDKLK